MKKKLILLILIINSYSFSSSSISDLSKITDVPYICRDTLYKFGCGDSLFWNSVKHFKDDVQSLIGIIDDTTSLNVSVPNFGGKYVVGDIAFIIIKEIIHSVPTRELIPHNSRDDNCGFITVIENRK